MECIFFGSDSDDHKENTKPQKPKPRFNPDLAKPKDNTREEIKQKKKELAELKKNSKKNDDIMIKSQNLKKKFPQENNETEYAMLDNRRYSETIERKKSRKIKNEENYEKSDRIKNKININININITQDSLSIQDPNFNQNLNQTLKKNIEIIADKLEEKIELNEKKSKELKSRAFSMNVDNHIIHEIKLLDPEKDLGNREYKLKLVKCSKERIEGLTTQMKFRLQEGHGECFYMIGVEDNGYPLGLNEEELSTSLETLKLIAEKLDATVSVVNENQGFSGKFAEVMITKTKFKEEYNKNEIRIGLIGAESSGKSTIVGVLVSGKVDNGKGLARSNVFRHKHEIVCGKTSSICHQIVGFDEKGRMTNHGNFGKLSWAQIVQKSAKIINFFDMGGSEKCFRTTLTALNPNYLDYIFIVIAADKGLTQLDEYFLKITNTMKVPILLIITKIDKLHPEDLKNFVHNLRELIKALKIEKNLVVIRNTDDLVLFSRNLEVGVIPVFLVSCTKNVGLNEFVNFLNILPSRHEEDIDILKKETVQFDILEISKSENKFFLGGILVKGILLPQKYYLGPFEKGQVKTVEVTSIHCKRIPVKVIYKGQYCSICISGEDLKYEDIRKGMVLISNDKVPIATKKFEAEIWTIDDTEKRVSSVYKPLLHINNIRQAACFSHGKMNEDKPGRKNTYDKEREDYLIISSKSKTRVVFEFLFNPEFISVNSNILINDNLLKAYGVITKLF